MPAPSASARVLLVALAMLGSACQPSLAGSTDRPTPGETVPGVASAAAPSALVGASATPVATRGFGAAPIGPTETAQVVDVVDGDTIKVNLGGMILTVRYIGMNTPETVAPGRPVEWMGPEASAANTALVADRTVTLERDVSETDRYGRLLRYVWLHPASGWLMVGLELVRRGFANAATYPPDVRYQELMLAAERQARDAGRGLWSATPPPGTSALPSAPAGGDCDPAYPGVCIPPPPPDLDCADIPFRRFEVLPPDPHHFDGDHNGIGCESG